MFRAHIAAVVIFLTTTPALAFELKKDSTGAPVSWRRAVEFVVSASLDSELKTPGAVDSARKAFATISGAAGLPVTVRTGETTGVGYDFAASASNRSEVVAISDWEWDDRAIAVTIVTVDSKNHAIVDADIALNISSRKFAVLPESSQGNSNGAFDDVQNTLTHELGHAVGLAHNEEKTDAVMYPAARRGEVSKRKLSSDDVAGLIELYGAVGSNLALVSSGASPEEQAAGCSAAPGFSGVLPLIASIWMVLRRRRAAALLAAAVAGTALAAEPRVANVADAATAVKAEVISRRTLPPANGARVLITELRVKTVECLKGACSDELVLYVPGGRYGDFEQTVEGLTVPEIGEPLAITVKPGVETMRPAPSRVRLFRLRHAPDFVAFLQGLVKADLVAGSSSPRK